MTEHRQGSTLGHVLAQEAIGVVFDGPLPGTVWVGEVDRRSGPLGNLRMTHQLSALIIGERLAHFQWHPVEGRPAALNDGGSGSAVHLSQQYQAAHSLNQGAYSGAVKRTFAHVAFPV